MKSHSEKSSENLKILSQNLFIRFKSLRVFNLKILNLISVQHDLKIFSLAIYKGIIENKYFTG